MSKDNVPSAGPTIGRRSWTGGPSGDLSSRAQRYDVTDDEIDRAVARLTDAWPSPTLRDNVVRAVAHIQAEVRGSEVRQAPGLRWRLALAAAAVILIATAIWLARRPAPQPQVAAGRTPGSDIALPVDRSPSPQLPPNVPPRSQVETGPVRTARTGLPSDRRGPLPAGSASANRWQGASGGAAQASSADDIAIAPLARPDPLGEPNPLHVPPLTLDAISLDRLETPPLQIDPVEGRPSKERER